jgi:preprotein translocase subunit SecA
VEIALRVFRHIYLEAIDESWVEHLQNMEHLRDGIGLRGYGQKDPKNEYKKEGYNLFVNLMARVNSNVLTKFFEVQIRRQEDIAAIEEADARRHEEQLAAAVARHPGDSIPDAEAPGQGALEQLREAAAAAAPRRSTAPSAPKVGRNDPCPCGSGKKFKKCHGAMLEEEEESDDQPRA